MTNDTVQAVQDVPSVVAAMLTRDGWQPLSFLCQLQLDTDVLLIDAVEATSCSQCDMYGDGRERCVKLYAEQDAALVAHIQTARPTAAARPLKVREMEYGEYDVVLSMDAILSPDDAAHALYAHFTHPPCSFVRTSPPAPYSLALINELSQLDELSSASSSSQPHLLQFPSLSLF